MSLDLPPASSRVLSQALADLIAQRQSGAPATSASTLAAGTQATTAATATSASSLLDLSAQARQFSATSLSSALSPATAGPAGTAPTALATLPALPTAGVNAPTQALVNTLLQQFQSSGTPLQAASIQAWPAPLLQQLQTASPADPPGLPLAKSLPPLQTWLVQQGTLPTQDGPRSYTMSLYVPAAWLGQQTPAGAATPLPTAVAQAPAVPAALARPATPLPSGVFALVLQAGAARTSALLHIEFAPQQQAAVYGKPMLNQPLDPWQQQAVLQASDKRRDLADHPARHSPLCDAPHCPYAGLAACPQPFCPALHVVRAVTGPSALPG